ncbi:MAG TPA: hypothetical protein VIM19_17525 [Actinomycetes bacterium]
MTDERRALRADDEARFADRHAGHRSHRWSMQGYRELHCGACCPPPPMSVSQLEAIGRILSAPVKERDAHWWRLTLMCGHRAEARAHMSHGARWHPPTHRCPDCEKTRGVVESECLGTPEVELPDGVTSSTVPPRRRSGTRAELQAENAALRARLAELGVLEA